MCSLTTECVLLRRGLEQGYHEGHLSPAKKPAISFTTEAKYFGDLNLRDTTTLSANTALSLTAASDDTVPSPLADLLAALPLEEEARGLLLSYSSALHTLLARAARHKVMCLCVCVCVCVCVHTNTR